MEVYVFPILVFLSMTTTFFVFLSSSAAAIDRIHINQPIKDGNTIVSDGETYELGFFSPGKSKSRYLGIWYNKISPCTVVWVANRETPITDAFGVFQVTRLGTLQVLSGGDNIVVIWSSNSTLISVSNVINPVAQLLDTGNLVVLDDNRNEENPIWQSFDYPGNTQLPGIILGKDLITGLERYLTSWKSPDDPSIGVYSFWVNTKGYPQIFKRECLVDDLRLAPWNGVGFGGLPVESTNPIYSAEFVISEKQIYYRYELKSSVLQRVIVMPDGIQVHLTWINRTQQWVVYENIVVDTCTHYGRCGPYGSCFNEDFPPCSCMEGFEPRITDDWNAGDWLGGCQRKKSLNCGTQDGFMKISGLKLPDTRHSWYNVSMTLGECEISCRRNCSCTAYANIDIRNGGSGCLLWFDDLMDITKSDGNRDLYIRMAISELAGQSISFNKKKVVLTVVLSISSVGLLLSALAYAYRKKRKRPRKKGLGNWGHPPDMDDTIVQMENVEELPFLSMHKIAKATDSFSIDNKIGEGGFGLVYKGVLEDGQLIAVKRLSETSEQGIDEFKNEIMCIAKLQHRNLVKLLGYCIHGNENILIYEYMDNKSLDSFLYDETKSSMLDWPQRFRIIHGIARGILYLHQDSRVQIIHRDLNAGNILLDGEMSPKISDFGIARKFFGQDALATTKVLGTYGYISPEYAVHGQYSTKSDVFSFGVLVLEIVSGKNNRRFCHEGHGDNLLGHAWRLYNEEKPIELMNASLQNSCVVSEVLRSIHVGLLCVQHHAEDRPTMLSVVLMLIGEGVLPPPKQPAFFTNESYRERDSASLVDEYMLTLL